MGSSQLVWTEIVPAIAPEKATGRMNSQNIAVLCTENSYIQDSKRAENLQPGPKL